MLIAAGNSGNGDDTIGSPGTAKSSATIGAMENMNMLPAEFDDGASLDLASFSSRGPTDDGRYGVDTCAPGFYIASARSDENPKDGHCSATYMAGTSMATPVTTGNAVLISQFFLEVPPSPRPKERRRDVTGKQRAVMQ